MPVPLRINEGGVISLCRGGRLDGGVGRDGLPPKTAEGAGGAAWRMVPARRREIATGSSGGDRTAQTRIASPIPPARRKAYGRDRQRITSKTNQRQFDHIAYETHSNHSETLGTPLVRRHGGGTDHHRRLCADQSRQLRHDQHAQQRHGQRRDQHDFHVIGNGAHLRNGRSAREPARFQLHRHGT